MEEELLIQDNIKEKNIGGNILPLYLKRKKHYKIISMCMYKICINDFDTKKSYISIQNQVFKTHFLFKKGIKLFKKLYFNIYTSKIEYEKLKELPTQNHIIYHFVGKDDISCRFAYDALFLKMSIGRHSRIHTFENMNMCCYIRQNKKNGMGLCVRNNNHTDKDFFKIFLARLLALFSFNSKIILLFEKNNEKYEESASIVYEKLIDEGKKAYFIINKKSPQLIKIKEKYRKNIIYSYTFKHYYYYFKCKKFIGSEFISHAMEVKCINKFVNLKLYMKRYNFVFLQHGVMYMVSLDSKLRTFFKKGNDMPINSKIVVSSKLEANHFVELGGFDYKDLYITGLPSYDKNVKNDDADKIIIMPTWMPWDYNMLESNYKESQYYNLILNALKNVPKELLNKVIILPHPLVKNKLLQTELKEYIPNFVSYDDELKKACLLITDYSSISYSAFYRGSNVIFLWKEKDYCMEKYKGHLMLNEKNAFGDICYEYKELINTIKKNYKTKQSKQNINRYKKIVEFSDNNNTKRLYNCLKKDHFFD